MSKPLIWLLGIAAWLLLALFCVAHHSHISDGPDTPAAQAPAALSALTLSKVEGQWWLKGAVPNSEAKAAVLAQSRSKLGEEVLSEQLQIDPRAPAVPADFPPDLRGLSDPLARWDGHKLTLKGKASLEKTLQSIRDALPSEFKNQLQDGLQIDAQAQERVQREIQNLLQQPLEFQTASDQLVPESQQRLNAIATQLTQVPDAEITISGHTDNAGQIQANQKLSQARADSVRDYLVQMGLPAAKMHTLAFGASQPIANNQTAAGRARNRRIEFKLQ